MRNINVTACTFIRNNFIGAFCLFESMASLLPYVKEMIVIDLESTDGTLGWLKEIEARNSRVKVLESKFTQVDAAAFADAANECVAAVDTDYVLFWQADEIWHQNLLLQMERSFDIGVYDLSFWRYQLRDNFQKMKWFPHPVHRVGPTNDFHFVGDGMNSDRVWSARICSEYDGSWFTKWGQMPELDIPTHDMILDVSLVGGFRDNIPGRRALHAPMWHEGMHVENIPVEEWKRQALHNPDWTKTETPFEIPHIMKRHVGRTKYVLDPDLLDALKGDCTEELLFP